MKKLTKGDIHPIVIFWLGVLTGAVLIALVFGYKVLDSVDYENRVIRYTPTKASIQAPDLVPPLEIKSFDSAESVSIGLPPGTKVIKPTSVDVVSIGLPPGTKVR